MSAARFRREAPHIFDVYYTLRQDPKTQKCDVVKQYPPDIDDRASLESVKKFCFPHSSGITTERMEFTYFTFTLTDSKGMFTYGHCRFSHFEHQCECFLSASPDISFFRGMLSFFTRLHYRSYDIDKCLEYVYNIPLPINERVIEFPIPDTDFSLPLRDADSYFAAFADSEVYKLYQFLHFNPTSLVQLYSSLLKERRILFIANDAGDLSKCTHASLRLLYPFHWQSIFVPILPSCLTDQLMAPMPFLIGVTRDAINSVNLEQFGEIVTVDIDCGEVVSHPDDVLPPVICKYLTKQIICGQKSFNFDSEQLVKAFLRANIIIFGRYRSGLCKAESFISSKITWDADKFVQAQPSEIKTFIKNFIGRDGVQYFECFIREKVEALNNGIGLNDEFDLSVRNVEEYYYEALQANKTLALKNTVKGAMSDFKNNTNAVFGSVNGFVQDKLKSKPSIVPKRKKHVSTTPLSFAPPTLLSPSKSEPSILEATALHASSSTASAISTPAPPAQASPGNSSAASTETKPSPIPQLADDDDNLMLLGPSITTSPFPTNPIDQEVFLAMQPGFSPLPSWTPTNPFVSQQSPSTSGLNNVVALNRESWEKFD